MHLYENGERSVYAWNAVDVEIDGSLQHGNVVGLEEKPENGHTPPRLIVDFGCPTQQAAVVEYGKIWDCSTYRFSEAPRGSAVEVLLHDGSQRPWKWYPGKMLIRMLGQLNYVALVEAMMDGQCRRELLPHRQIRLPSREPHGRGSIAAGDFVKQTYQGTGISDYWAQEGTASPWLLRQVEQELQLHVLKVLGNEMHFLRRRQDFPWAEADILRAFERKAKHSGIQCELLNENEKLQQKEQLDVGEHGLWLPFEVLKEIFRSLDTVDRQRCRRTCQLWETLLTSAGLCTEVRVSRQRPSQRIQWDGDYLVYACFFKHIAPNTRTISLCNVPGTEDAKGDMGGLDAAIEQLVREVSNDMGVRMEHSMLHQPQRTIVIRHSGMERWNLTALAAVIAALLARRASCWDRMVLKG